MSSMEEYLRRLAEKQGRDFDALMRAGASGPSVLGKNWSLEDPTAHRVEQAEKTLAYEMDGTFADARADHPAVIDWVRRYLAGEFEDRLPWLTLVGDTGAGKTRETYGVLRELVLAEAHANRTCRWWVVSHPDLSWELQPKRDGSHESAIDPYVKADILVLHDLGAGSLNEYGQRGLQLGVTKLLDERYRRRRTTIIDTNLDPEQQRQSFGDRIPSRMREGTVVALLDDDHRDELGEWHQ